MRSAILGIAGRVAPGRRQPQATAAPVPDSRRLSGCPVWPRWLPTHRPRAAQNGVSLPLAPRRHQNRMLSSLGAVALQRRLAPRHYRIRAAPRERRRSDGAKARIADCPHDLHRIRGPSRAPRCLVSKDACQTSNNATPPAPPETRSRNVPSFPLWRTPPSTTERPSSQFDDGPVPDRDARSLHVPPRRGGSRWLEVP